MINLVFVLNIALVTETFPPEVNGVAMTLEKLAVGLVERGHELRVIRPSRGVGDRAVINDGICHVLVPGAKIPGYPDLQFGFPSQKMLFQYWRVEPPTLVHVATQGPLGWSAVSAARRLNIPVTSSFHTNFHSYGRHYSLFFIKRAAMAYLKWFHNRTSATFAPTRGTCLELAREGMRNLKVMGRGVNLALFSPKQRSQSLRASWNATDGPVVIHVGRLAPEKNIPLAIRAFEAIRENIPQARLVFAGSGPLEERLRSRHPDFIFSGVRRGRDLAAHYASADLFLFPSLTETYGNVLTEAMASGLPVLAFDYAAAGEHITTRKNGVTVPFGNEDAFIAAARDLGGRIGHLNELKAAARQTAESLTWDTVVDQWEEALTIIGERGSRRNDSFLTHRYPI